MTRAQRVALETRLSGGKVQASLWLTLLLGGVVGLPAAAAAQNECGPAAGGQAACAPATYPTGISYAQPSPFTLTLQQDATGAVNVTNGGVQLSTTGLGLGALVRGIGPAGAPAPTGPSIVNTAGDGLTLSAVGGGDLLLDVRDPAGAGSSFLVRGSGSGIVATASGGGGATVLLGAGSVTGAAGTGVQITAAGPVTVDTGTAAITAPAGDGVAVTQNGPTGAVSITTGGPITGANGSTNGISVAAQDPTNTAAIAVTVNGAITQEGVGVLVLSSGSRNVTLTTGTGGTVTGTSDALTLATSGTGTITVNTNANLLGDTNAGGVGNAMTLTSRDGAITVNTAAGTSVATLNSIYDIRATSGSGPITINNAAALTGVNATGISLESQTGSITVNSNGLIGTADLAIRGGVSATVDGGAGNIVVNSASNVFTSGPASILTSNQGTGTSQVNVTSATLTAYRGDAISTTTASGANTVTVTSQVLATQGFGVRATAGTGAISVNVLAGGGVTGGQTDPGSTVNGAGGVVEVGSGAVSLSNAGVIAAQVGPAASLSPNGPSATITNAATGVLTSTGAALRSSTIFLGGISGLTLDNAGTITATSGDHDGIVFASGSQATAVLNNQATGTINGRFNSTGGSIVFGNAGLWNTNGVSTFGGAASAAGRSFVNTGTVQAGASAGATAVSATSFLNLGLIDNRGAISLANGVAGDTLSSDGGYVGSGAARLTLDIGTQGVVIADTLRLGATANGSTAVSLTAVSPLGFTSGTLLVQAAIGSSPTAFVIAPDSVNVGLTRNAIVYDATTGGYFLVSTPNASAAETARFAELRHTLWYATQESWSSHLGQLRDAQGPTGRGVDTGLYSWGQVFGGVHDRSGSQAVTVAGAGFNVDAGYDQSYEGGQVGVELLEDLFVGSAVLGVTAGYVNSHAGFGGSGDDVDLHEFNVGVYANYVTPFLFVNGLLKFDAGSMDIDSAASSFKRSLDTRQFGATVEAGHRFQRGAWYAEPVVSATYLKGYVSHGGDDERQNTLDLFGSTLTFPDDSSGRVRVGVRAGMGAVRFAGVSLTPYAEASAVQEVLGRDKVVFGFGATSFPVSDDRPSTFGAVRLGGEMRLGERLSLAFQADGEFGGEVTGGGARVTASYHW